MICVTDRRLPFSAVDALTRLGSRTILLPPCPSLPEPVSSHADLLLFPLGNDLLVRREYFNLAQNVIEEIASAASLNIILSDAVAGKKYPEDVGLCACTAGRYLICRAGAADPLLLRLVAQNGFEIIDVNQGYTKCSCAVTGDGSVITSDNGIASALQHRGIPVLTISPGHISLPGYNTGFIGGCAGLFGDVLYFAGDLQSHPDHEKIKDFCAAHGTRPLSLTDSSSHTPEPLFDVGSLFFF